MARPREFDPRETLQAAISMFWEKGYYDSSVDELVKRSGVAKYGIYGTFGTKRELFMKALHQYANDRHFDIQFPIRKPNASLKEIHSFFKEASKRLGDKDSRRGCLVCNTGMELGMKEPEVREFVKEFFRDIKQVMKDCLKRAIKKGDLDKKTKVDSLAAYLVTEFRTILMLAASGHTRRDIENHLKVALRVLD